MKPPTVGNDRPRPPVPCLAELRIRALSPYREAVCEADNIGGRQCWVIYASPEEGARELGWGWSTEKAWADAESRLPRVVG